MGLFSVREARNSTIEDGIIPIRSSGHYTAGIALTADSVSTHSAVWRCKNVYVDLLSTLPFSAYRDTDGVPVMLGTQPPVVDRPSVSTDKIGWVAQVVESLIMRGNVWGYITSFGANGWPTNVEILHPDAVTPRWDWRTRELEVRVFGEVVDPARLWHRAINMTAGSPLGMSTIEAARTSIGVGIAAQRYGSNWFTEGGHPSSLLSTEQSLTAEQAAEMKERWRTMVREGSVAVLSQGMDYKPVALSPADAQFLESIDASGQDVCRFFKLPPETAGYASGESMTYSNVESQWLNLLIASLNPVLTVVEKAWTDLLPTAMYVQANRDALLRMTTKERYEAHRIATGGAAWKSVNEVRVIEELPPVEGGDDLSGDTNGEARELTEIIQKIYLGVGVVLTPDEARDIANRAGANLTGSSAGLGPRPITNP